MSCGTYILNGKIPVRCDDTEEWGRWFYNADRRVAYTDLPDGGNVSTVFLGIDHQWEDGKPPLLFESMIFNNDRDGGTLRYSTWEEAKEGHKKIVGEYLK